MPEQDKAKEPTPAGREVPLVSLAEIAKALKLSPVQVKKMSQNGQIPAVKVEGEWRYNLDLVREAVKKRSRGF